MKKLLTLLAALLCYSYTQAQFQDGLDPTFGDKGVANHGGSVIDDFWEISNAVLQKDGKIVGVSSKRVYRFNNDGSLDKSFGTDGIFSEILKDDHDTLLTYFYSGHFMIAKLQRDNKIVVVGTADASYPQHPIILMFRLLPNGSLDPTFGRKGVVCNNTFGEFGTQAMEIQADDKIVVSGDPRGADNFQTLLRYMPNGTIDSSFGINGKVTNTLVKNNEKALAMLPDGRILALFDGFGVARYMPDGSPDTSFNHTGRASFFSGFSAPFTDAMDVQSDGKIVLAGHTLFDDPAPFVAARFNSDGSIDSSFGSSGLGYGIYDWDTGDINKCADMLSLPDDKLIVGGRVANKSTPNARYNFAVIRIDSNGNADSSFGKNARLFTSPNGLKERNAGINKLLYQPDNKVIALGDSWNMEFPATTATLVRYATDGKTSISELPRNKSEPISVYPNPAQNMLYISNTSQQKIESIGIFSLIGSSVLTIQNTNNIDISLLSNGMYIVAIQTEYKNYYQKIIIQK